MQLKKRTDLSSTKSSTILIGQHSTAHVYSLQKINDFLPCGQTLIGDLVQNIIINYKKMIQ